MPSTEISATSSCCYQNHLYDYSLYTRYYSLNETYIPSFFSLVYNDVTEITNGEQPQVKGRDDPWTYLNSIVNLALDACQDPFLAHAYRGLCRETSGCRQRPKAGVCRSTEALEVTPIWHLRLALNSQQKIKRSKTKTYSPSLKTVLTQSTENNKQWNILWRCDLVPDEPQDSEQGGGGREQIYF